MSETQARIDPGLLAGNRRPMADYKASHFAWQVVAGVATITLNRPERKNPLTFESYAELRDLFHALRLADDVHAVVIGGAGGNFCSGGDVHEIIGPLLRLKAPELLMFTRMTGDLVKAMRHCPQPIVAAIDGICAGAGAIIAMASDLRLGTARSKTAFLFNRVGLAGCDMGACAPSFANGITKTMLHQEWAMTIDQAIEAEAQAQALCMLTQDFQRAYDAFVAKARPQFEGN